MSVVEAPARHQWRLVAPWWHWPAAEGSTSADRAAVRAGAPVIQKYDSPDLVNTFVKDPQLRLKYKDDIDLVHLVAGSPFGGYPTRTRTDLLKLYLGSHHRHYLVVCSLHCDTPGFPYVGRDGICEAGFVVRRRKTSLDASAQAEAAKASHRWLRARARRQGAESQVAAAKLAGSAGAVRLASIEARVAGAAKAEEAALATVRKWASEMAVSRSLEGWVPSGVQGGKVVPLPPCAGRDAPGAPTPLAGTGSWRAVSEMPEALEEASFPLYPLVAGNGVPEDAVGESIYFGVVPTGSSDLELAGGARFDDHTAYEIRCFVRRHRPQCPTEHCRCPIVWSDPTRAYQLASQFDLQGTSNRPITIQMPDLAQLQADALRLGAAGGVRFQYPPNSSMPITSDNLDASAGSSSFQFCSFSIPLITIVATFVFKLFLPIVVFVFQLWFLLALRFCIPPSFGMSAGLESALDAMGGGLEIDAAIAASISPIAGPMTGIRKEMDDLLKVQLQGNVFRDGKSLADRFRSAAIGGSLNQRTWAAVARSVVTPRAVESTDREFAPRVRRDEVVRP